MSLYVSDLRACVVVIADVHKHTVLRLRVHACCGVRPVLLLTLWISECLTQAQS